MSSSSKTLPRKSRAPRHHISIRDVAERLGRSTNWVRQRIASGEFEAFLHGRASMTVSLESIVAWEDQHRVSKGMLKAVA